MKSMGSSLGKLFRRSTVLPVKGSPVNKPPQQTTVTDPKLYEPSNELLDRLKDVYVESTTDTVTHDNPYNSDQRDKLPQDRRPLYTDPFSVSQVTEGYLTYQQVLEVFHKHRQDWTVDKLATEYKLDKVDLDNLFKYYSSYRVIGKMDNKSPPMELHALIK